MIASTSANIFGFINLNLITSDIIFKSISAVFSGITVIILYKTYTRAKNTIFQPFHQEALKRQIILFEAILEDIPSGLILEPIDYKETLELTIKQLKGEDISNFIGSIVLPDNNNRLIKCIYVSKNLNAYLNRLQKYIFNPLIPRKIKLILENINEDIYKNLKINMIDYIEKNEKNPNLFNFKNYDYWNKYNHLRIKHESNFNKLRIEINKFFKIKEMI